MPDPSDIRWDELSEVVGLDGSDAGDTSWISRDLAVAMYRDMVRTRVFDRRATSAQRQGRIGTYAIAEGHEAVQIGSAHALREHDFVYPGYREHGVQIARGMSYDTILSYWRGLPNASWDPVASRQMVVTVPIGSHLPHAVGHAYADRLAGRDVVTMAYIGDGGTSENDFHSGLSFAGVWKTPTVFILSNNFYAISVPLEQQTAAAALSDKGAGYGVAAERVNGFDVFAVYEATRRAVERGAAGGGPTLIEAVCYRFGPHATADDPSLYRTRDEEELWRPYDPIDRARRFLESREWWDGEADERLLAEAGEEFDESLDRVTSQPLPPRADIVAHAFDRIPRSMVEQLNRLERDAGEEPTELASALHGVSARAGSGNKSASKTNRICRTVRANQPISEGMLHTPSSSAS